MSASQTHTISCEVVATPVERTSYGEGEVPDVYDGYRIGNEITIGTEKFNIISTTDTTVTMLAQYNLGTDYLQTEEDNYVKFSDSNGWDYEPAPQEIDIQSYDGKVKTYVNEYVSYLQGVTYDSSLTGTLITLTELESLDCPINYDSSVSSELNCINSEYADWLINGQYWWTRSADADSSTTVWVVYVLGNLLANSYSDSNGVRPVITMSKEKLENYFNPTLISFTIEGTTYQAVEGMIWEQWVESDYDVNDEFDIYKVYVRSGSSAVAANSSSGTIQNPDDEIIDGTAYYFYTGCFTAGTQVTVSLDGQTKNIEDVQEGDSIVSYNIATGEYYLSRVKNAIKNVYSVNMARVELANGTILEMTDNHPIYTSEGWRSITNDNYEKLVVGDFVKTTDGWIEITNITLYTLDEPITTYTLNVMDDDEEYDEDSNDNFVVNGVTAHNLSEPIGSLS